MNPTRTENALHYVGTVMAVGPAAVQFFVHDPILLRALIIVATIGTLIMSQAWGMRLRRGP